MENVRKRESRNTNIFCGRRVDERKKERAYLMFGKGRKLKKATLYSILDILLPISLFFFAIEYNYVRETAQ